MAPFDSITADSRADRADAASSEDEHWMQRCLQLARNGAGHVSPNPMVGAVLVGPDGTVLGEGWHQRFGYEHAEPNAVAEAERRHNAAALQEATLYVNLEPCSHHGKTPPCSALVIQKQIPRVVIGMQDPNPKVSGRSIRRLREHGVDVTVGILEEQCRRLNEAFIHHLQTGRPLVTLKMAQTLDGHVATTSGDARWVSGTTSRTLVHRWRAELDAVLVGSGTARVDDPALTVRHVDGRQPMRIVLDRTGALRKDLQLFTDEFAHHTIAVIGESRPAPAYEKQLQAAGGGVLRAPEKDGHLNLKDLLQHLGREFGPAGRPLQTLLVEAGPGLATALFQQDLVDRFFLFVAPKLLGDGVPTLSQLGINKMRSALTFAEGAWKQIGEDMLFQGYRRDLQ